MRNAAAVAVLALALAGCIEPRYYRATGATVYEPTDWGRIAVLEAVPPGAEVLGDVEGSGRGWGMVFHDDEITDAKKGAAKLGADAIVIEATGSGTAPGDPFARRAPTVRVKALRVTK